MLLATTDAEIAACFPVLLALRPHLREHEFVARVQKQITMGYVLAFRRNGQGRVVSAAGYRIINNLAWGKMLYIDDLITIPEARGQGHGGTLLDQVIALAREQQCNAVHLDSGVQRYDAHRLYLNHGFVLGSHHFALDLK